MILNQFCTNNRPTKTTAATTATTITTTATTTAYRQNAIEEPQQ